MNKNIFMHHFDDLLKWYGKPVNALIKFAYYDRLADTGIPDEAIGLVFAEAIARYNFFPTSEEILECWQGSYQGRALAEWIAIEQHLKAGNRSLSEIKLSQHGINALIAIGGIEAFGDGFLSNRGYLQKSFLEIWRSLYLDSRCIKAVLSRQNFLDDGIPQKMITASEMGEKITIQQTPNIEYEYYLDENGNPCAKEKTP